MFLTVTRPEQDTTMEVTAGVTERATIANGIGATMALLSFRAEVADTSDGLKLLVLCGEDYLKSYVANKQIINLDKFGEILHCTALGGFANLRDPLRAKAAVISKYGNSLDNRTLQQQRELINREYSTFQKAGKVAVAITKIKAARDAVIAAVAPLSDAIQNLALQGEAFDIQLELSGSLKTSSRLDSFAVFDATGYEMADFASPSGAILCGLNSDRAVCMLSSAMTPSGLAQLPTDEEACGAGASSSSVSLNGIGLAGGRTYWACSGEILAYPLRGSPTAQWNAAAGFPWVTAGEVLSGPKASLPYGSAIKIGHFGCTSQTTGISCYDLTTGRGFTVNKDGVRRIAK
ncbi:MAG: hypothetical protein IPO80_04845 [Propionibacteriaceae bacterium]|nr:hypothetical protein [Propionibacteriaceae bacterium]